MENIYTVDYTAPIRRCRLFVSMCLTLIRVHVNAFLTIYQKSMNASDAILILAAVVLCLDSKKRYLRQIYGGHHASRRISYNIVISYYNYVYIDDKRLFG